MSIASLFHPNGFNLCCGNFGCTKLNSDKISCNTINSSTADNNIVVNSSIYGKHNIVCDKVISTSSVCTNTVSSENALINVERPLMFENKNCFDQVPLMYCTNGSYDVNIIGSAITELLKTTVAICRIGQTVTISISTLNITSSGNIGTCSIDLNNLPKQYCLSNAETGGTAILSFDDNNYQINYRLENSMINFSYNNENTHLNTPVCYDNNGKYEYLLESVLIPVIPFGTEFRIKPFTINFVATN